METATRLTFPPFPPTKSGVISFKEFKEAGIVPAVNGSSQEIDGRGIPTVALPVKHDTDRVKQPKKPVVAPLKSKATPGQAAHIATPWWDIWRETEGSKLFKYTIHESKIARLQQAAADFKTSRHWSPQLSLNWDHFRRFLGLIGNSNQGVKTKEPLDIEDDYEMDSDEEFANVENLDTSNIQSDKRQGSEVPDSEYDGTLEGQMNSFLRNPTHSVSIFLSTYLRKHGLLWGDNKDLTIHPRLVDFFVEFLIRNRTFPDINEMQMQSAQAITKTAILELPKTKEISQIDDLFGKACTDCWGSKADTSFRFEPAGDDSGPHDNHVQPMDTDRPVPHWAAPSGDEPWGTAEHISAAWDVEMNMEETPSWHPDLGANWSTAKTLIMSLLGPTAIFLTHQLGCVELSTRKIGRIEGPSKQTTSITGSSAQAAVENELDRRFSKIVLSPLVLSEPTDEFQPVLRLLEGSSNHDPGKDTITLLLEPTAAQVLTPGMYIKAHWVQFIRLDEGPGLNMTYWYMDGDPQMVLPSYHFF